MRLSFKRIMSLLLCILMLLSCFTVVTAQEKRVTAKMAWADSFNGFYEYVENSSSIFNATDLEPGESVTKYIKVENAGDLAFSYAFQFTSETQIGELAEVIDVYAKTADAKIEFVEEDRLGTLAEVFNGTEISTGKILPAAYSADGYSTGYTVVAISLKLRDNIDNKYQGKSVGAFNVKLTATEDRSFGDYPDKFKIKFENTDKYLYRVGNANAVKLGSLFEELNNVKVGNVSIDIESLDSATDVSGTYAANATDWTQGTIKFEGTGPVKVTIDDNTNTNAVSLNLEVIDATNVTTYSELSNRNSVFLNDITMSSGRSFYLSNATLYGNGFTFDVSKGAYTSTGSISENYLVGLYGSSLDNVKITGAVYTEYGAEAKNDYNRATVLSKQNSTITNSYISNCASPLRVADGSIYVKNTTFKGGNFANIDIRGGNITLDNITTINQVNGNDTAANGEAIVGLGIVIYYENVQDTTTVDILNGIKQYNNISDDINFKNNYANQLKNQIFTDELSKLHFNDGTKLWANTGIVSMMEGIGKNNITLVNGYEQAYPVLGGSEGYVHTCVPTAQSIVEPVSEYEAIKQCEIEPEYSFEYPIEGNKNYVPLSGTSKNHCYYDSSTGDIRIDFDQGKTSVEFDTQILSVSKNSIPLDYTVTLDGSPISGTKITFNDSSAGNHTIEYKYTDSYNYTVDEIGNPVAYPVTYTKTINVIATSVAPDAKNATFTFADTNTPTEIVEIAGNNYIVPKGITSNSADWGYITVGGQKVFYPITEATISKSIAGKVTAYFYVFNDVITITDYENAGTGGAVTYNSSTKNMPSNLAVIKGYYGQYSSISSAIMNDSSLSQNGPENTFKYYASSTASSTPSFSSGLRYSSPTNLNTSGRDESITIAQYRYVDNAGKTYFYYVGYHMTSASDASSGCLASGTKITLADGSTKNIEDVTYDDELLVWNFIDGKYDTVPSALIINDGEDEYTVITLTFDDGTDIRLIDIHGLYDADLNKFVYIAPENVADYVGHNFVKTSLEGNSTAKLVDYAVTTEYTGCYTIQTAMHVNCVADGLLTQTPPLVEGYFDYFEMGEGMQYDPELMQSDIEKYGLYTYEDFDDYISYDAFMALNGPYLKVAVGKGYFDFKFLIDQIDEFGVGVGYPYVTPIDDPGIMPINILEEDELISTTVISPNNNITAAEYSVEIACDNATEKEGVYICTSNTAVFTLTSNDTKGYVTITVDGDDYTAPVNGSYDLTIKNAKDKAVTFKTSWGNAELNITNNIIDLGVFVIKSVEITETGVSALFSNTTKYPVTGDIFVAVYDADNRLVKVMSQLNTIIDGKDDNKEVNFTIDVPNGCTVKAFTWETGSTIPLTASNPN